ncbi:nucleotide exchange factor GrpE [Anaerorudis cellulosivorans]|uniref:nucleotide exchange factor GrpE n=1 Tax=Anaerorudis cellulosivorans TaxID=3397862 RepID=UPI0039B6EDCC
MEKENKKYSDPQDREQTKRGTSQSEEAMNNEVKDNLSEKMQTPETGEQQELQQKYDELNDSYLRLFADFDNYRKRTLKEKADIIKSGGEKVLKDIIPLIDDFERAIVALHQSDDKEAILEGIDLIYNKFMNFLQQHGIKEIEAIGLPFDPEKFEAVGTIPAPEESQEGVVIDLVQKGYTLNDKVIRFPKVIVGA